MRVAGIEPTRLAGNSRTKSVALPRCPFEKSAGWTNEMTKPRHTRLSPQSDVPVARCFEASGSPERSSGS